ncbi:hypothetical protein QDA04_gp50 [Microbacterium phage Megan]|uniref:DUF7694 domain-containing protein n=1 Tax=Microbacterium phage Megan TaxID=2656551 RepID=A0A649VK06_9CAUD|nr:hypothetical protein QDA04_gp50 [Microbacterium phage Megan]QGJ92720.1 hypothetical protein PBI_MEGAN_50 [Microbacterium phage Megan]
MASTDAFAAPGSRHEPPPPWTRGAVPDDIASLDSIGLWNARVHDGILTALRSKDDGLWHLSVSHTSRLPSWDEIADARYRFLPDRARMAMLLPPRAEWVNVHERTLHLWELVVHVDA